MTNKSIIIPAFNEEKGIIEVIRRCKKISVSGDEIIVVSDGSTDKTTELAKREHVKVFAFKKNKGKAIALRKGFESARNEILITIDADCTMPPEKIPLLVKKLEDNDLVIGTRFSNCWPKSISWHRVFANKIGAIFASIILGKKITDVTTGLRAFRKKMIKGMKIKAKGLDFEAELTAKAITKRYRYIEVSVAVKERKGSSSLKFFKDIYRFTVAILRGKFTN